MGESVGISLPVGNLIKQNLVLMLLPVLFGIGLHYAWPKAAEKTDKVLGNLRKRDKKLEGCLRIC